jgi:hypothetical protein
MPLAMAPHSLKLSSHRILYLGAIYLQSGKDAAISERRSSFRQPGLDHERSHHDLTFEPGTAAASCWRWRSFFVRGRAGQR